MRLWRPWIAALLLPVVFCQYSSSSSGGYDATPIGAPVHRPIAPLSPRTPFPRGYQPPPQAQLFQPPRSYYQSNRATASNLGGPQVAQFRQNANFAPPRHPPHAPSGFQPVTGGGWSQVTPTSGWNQPITDVWHRAVSTPPTVAYNREEHRQRQIEAERMVLQLAAEARSMQPRTAELQYPGIETQFSADTPLPSGAPSHTPPPPAAPQNEPATDQDTNYNPSNNIDVTAVEQSITHSNRVIAPARTRIGVKVAPNGAGATQSPAPAAPQQQQVAPALPVPQPDAPHRLVFTPKTQQRVGLPPSHAPPPIGPSSPIGRAHSSPVQSRQIIPGSRHAPATVSRLSATNFETTITGSSAVVSQVQREVVPAGLNSLEKNPPDIKNDIIVHIYLNSKERKTAAHSQTRIGPIHGAFGIGTSFGGPGTHTNPIVIVKDFDKDRLSFVENGMAEMMVDSGEKNIVEVKAMVSTPDRKIERTLNKAVDSELDRAIPLVLRRFHGSMTAMDADLRKELEQALVDEIAKNLGETIDEMSTVSEEDLGKLIEEGFNEFDKNLVGPTETSTASTTTVTTQRPTVRVTVEMITEEPTTTTRKATTTTERTTTTQRARPTTESTTTSSTSVPTTTSRTPPPRTFRITTTVPTTTTTEEVEEEETTSEEPTTTTRRRVQTTTEEPTITTRRRAQTKTEEPTTTTRRRVQTTTEEPTTTTKRRVQTATEEPTTTTRRRVQTTTTPRVETTERITTTEQPEETTTTVEVTTPSTTRPTATRRTTTTTEPETTTRVEQTTEQVTVSSYRPPEPPLRKEEKVEAEFQQENSAELEEIDHEPVTVPTRTKTTVRPSSFAGDNMMNTAEEEATVVPQESPDMVTIPLPTSSEEERIATLSPVIPMDSSEDEQNVVTSPPIRVNEEEEATTLSATSALPHGTISVHKEENEPEGMTEEGKVDGEDEGEEVKTTNGHTPEDEVDEQLSSAETTTQSEAHVPSFDDSIFDGVVTITTTPTRTTIQTSTTATTVETPQQATVTTQLLSTSTQSSTTSTLSTVISSTESTASSEEHVTSSQATTTTNDNIISPIPPTSTMATVRQSIIIGQRITTEATVTSKMTSTVEQTAVTSETTIIPSTDAEPETSTTTQATVTSLKPIELATSTSTQATLIKTTEATIMHSIEEDDSMESPEDITRVITKPVPHSFGEQNMMSGEMTMVEVESTHMGETHTEKTESKETLEMQTTKTETTTTVETQAEVTENTEPLETLETQTLRTETTTTPVETQTLEGVTETMETFEEQTPKTETSTIPAETQTQTEVTASMELETQTTRTSTKAAETQTLKGLESMEKEETQTPITTKTTTPSPTTTAPHEMIEAPTETDTDLKEAPTTTSTSSSSEEEVQPQTESITVPKAKCPIPNDLSDHSRGDVLFLLDSSNSFDEDKFMHAITLILHTVDHFKNIGPNGIQVSLVQFNNDPYLEFSFRKHNCRQWLKDDIADTEYLTGGNMLGKALEKVSKFAFTKKRGDRDDAENILVVVTDGQSDDRVQVPVKVAKENNVTVLVIATLEADPHYLSHLTGDMDNVFHLNSSPNMDLAAKLAERIGEVGGATTTEVEQLPSEDESNEMIIVPHGNTLDGDELREEESVNKIASEVPEVHGVVHLECLTTGFKIKFNVASTFEGIAVVKGHENEEKCTKEIVPVPSNGGNQSVDFFVSTESCGVTKVKSLVPAGRNSSLVLQLLHRPSLRTIDDRAFLLQCYQSDFSSEDRQLSAELDVLESEVLVAETISLSSVPPSCTYSLRKDSAHGPLITKAVVGQTVYHRWDCDGGDKANSVYGIQIHSCYASSDVEQKYAIVNERGCSSDLSVLSDPVYEDDTLSAYAQSHVFGFQNTESLKFICKLSLCTRDGDGCEGVSPPTCSSNHSGLLLSRKLRHQNSALDGALTSALSTEVGVSRGGSFSNTLEALTESKLSWAVACATLLTVVLIVVFSRTYNGSSSAGSSSVSSLSDPESGSIDHSADFRANSGDSNSVSGSTGPVSTVSGPPINPRLAEFMKDFQRDRYV